MIEIVVITIGLLIVTILVVWWLKSFFGLVFELVYLYSNRKKHQNDKDS